MPGYNLIKSIRVAYYQLAYRGHFPVRHRKLSRLPEKDRFRGSNEHSGVGESERRKNTLADDANSPAESATLLSQTGLAWTHDVTARLLPSATTSKRRGFCSLVGLADEAACRIWQIDGAEALKWCALTYIPGLDYFWTRTGVVLPRYKRVHTARRAAG